MIALQPLSDAVLCSQALLALGLFAGSVGSLLGHQRGIRTPISMSTEQEPDLAERDYGRYEGRPPRDSGAADPDFDQRK